MALVVMLMLILVMYIMNYHEGNLYVKGIRNTHLLFMSLLYCNDRRKEIGLCTWYS